MSIKGKSFVAVFSVLMLGGAIAEPAPPDFQITSPRGNAVVSGEVVEVSGLGADPTGTVQVEVLTNDWYVQDGNARVNSDGSWTFSPVLLAGKGAYNNHTVRATIIRNGQRGKSATITGVVRKQ